MIYRQDLSSSPSKNKIESNKKWKNEIDMKWQKKEEERKREEGKQGKEQKVRRERKKRWW